MQLQSEELLASVLAEIERARVTEDRDALAASLFRMATLYRQHGEPMKAITPLKELLALQEETQDHQVMIPTLLLLGDLYRRQGGWHHALALYDRACAMQEAAGDKTAMAATIGSMGVAYEGMEMWEEALTTYRQSLSLKESLGDLVGVALIWNNIGNVEAKRRRFEEAFDSYGKSLAIQERAEDRLGQSMTLANLASLHQHRGEWEEATLRYRECLSLVGKEDPQRRAAALNGLGFVRKKVGDLEGAIAAYEEALRLLEASGDHLRSSVVLHNMALIHEERNEWRDALRLMEQVISIDKRIGHPDLKQDMEVFRRIRSKLDAERDAHQ
ncbi:MAG: TPR domain protein [candidate division NC10 bacterium]|nr:TPR domain protein [candidate division NC10 bacterium]